MLAMSAEGSRKAILAAFFANLGIAISKFIGFAISGSASMLAEAIHSCADTGNQLLLMLGGKRAKRQATEEHSFGYGRERYFWSFAVALVLFSVGGLFAIYEGIHKLQDPHPPQDYVLIMVILVVAILLECYSMRTAVVETRKVKPKGQSYWGFVRHTKSAELPVVLLEDLGALIGLFLALFGVSMAHVTDDGRWDALGSIAIGVLLVVIAVILVIQMKSLLIGESATAEARAAIEAAIVGGAGVRSVIHMRTVHLGPEEILVAAKIELESSVTYEQLAGAINDAEARVRAAAPDVKTIYLEPDVRRATPPNPRIS